MTKLNKTDSNHTATRPSAPHSEFTDKGRSNNKSERGQREKRVHNSNTKPARGEKSASRPQKNLLAKDNVKRSAVDDMQTGRNKTAASGEFFEALAGGRGGLALYSERDKPVKVCVFADIGVGVGYSSGFDISTERSAKEPRAGFSPRAALTSSVEAKAFGAAGTLSVEHDFLEGEASREATLAVGSLAVDLLSPDTANLVEDGPNTAVDRSTPSNRAGFGASAAVVGWFGAEYCFDVREGR